MNAINCLVHIDDINYKIVIQKDGVFVANFDDLSKAISKNEDLKEYDLTQEFFIFEIFDKELNEYVRFDKDTQIMDMSKIRVKVLDPNEIIQKPQIKMPTENCPFYKLVEGKSPGEVLELFVEKHIPPADMIEKVGNPNINQGTFTVENIRVKKQLIKSIIACQESFCQENVQSERVWEMICGHFKDFMGLRILQLTKNRNDLGFVRYTPRFIENEFKVLMGQYNRLLRMCSNLCLADADKIWPFFRIFHKTLKINKMYPERAPSLEIMQKEFDEAMKDLD